MEINLNRSEKVIVFVATTAIGVFFVLFLQINKGGKSTAPQFETSSAIDYKMARPEQAYSEYNLDGRELDQSYEALTPAEQKLVKKKLELVAKQKEEDKKKEETKKKQATLAKVQATQAVARAQALKAAAAARSTKAAVPAKAAQDSSARANQSNNNNSGYAANVAPVPVVEDANPKNVNKKTFTEWRSIIFATPTSDNLILFVNAFRRGEVTSAEYQAMAQDLIDQEDTKLQALGLMALRSSPSLASLSQLAHIEATQLTSYQSYIQQSLNAYIYPQNVQFLNQALLTKDKKLVIKSLTLLNVSLTKISQGDYSSLIDPRSKRDTEVTTLAISNFRSLVPSLNQIVQLQDQELSSLAQQVATLIHNAGNVAQN